MQKKWQALRDAAYAEGWTEYDELVKIPTFRDFVALYIAQGHKRNRNRASFGNSAHRVLALAAGWFARLSQKQLWHALQYHADQNLAELRKLWASVLEIEGEAIKLQRKSNSGQAQRPNVAICPWCSHCGRLGHDAPCPAAGVD